MFLIKTQIALIFLLLFWSNIQGFIIKDNRRLTPSVENGTDNFPLGLKSIEQLRPNVSPKAKNGASTRKISEKTGKNLFSGNFPTETRQVKLRTHQKEKNGIKKENYDFKIRTKRAAIGKVKKIKTKHHKKKDKGPIASKPDPFLPLVAIFVLILIVAVFLTACICSVQFERERLTKQNQEALDAGFSDKLKSTGIFFVCMRVLGRCLNTVLCCKFKDKLKQIPLFHIESTLGTGKAEYLSASYIERLNDEKLDHLLGKKVSHSGRAKSSPARPVISTGSAEERRAMSLPNNPMSSSLHKRSVAEAGKKRSSLQNTNQHHRTSRPTIHVGSFTPPQYIDNTPPAPTAPQGYNRPPPHPPHPPRH